MQSRRQKLLAYALLVLYGGISLLGHGLHWLALDASLHEGAGIVQCAAHHDPADGDCAVHNCQAKCATAKTATGRDGVAIASGECAKWLVECRICKFLVQARSAEPRVGGAVRWQAVTPAVLPATADFGRQRTPRGPQVPRGPPRTIARAACRA